MKLVNHRTEESRVEVNVATGGTAEKVSDGGKVTLNDFRASDWDRNGDYGYNEVIRLNQHSDVEWELVLEPGQTKELTYEVVYFVR